MLRNEFIKSSLLLYNYVLISKEYKSADLILGPTIELGFPVIDARSIDIDYFKEISTLVPRVSSRYDPLPFSIFSQVPIEIAGAIWRSYGAETHNIKKISICRKVYEDYIGNDSVVSKNDIPAEYQMVYKFVDLKRSSYKDLILRNRTFEIKEENIKPFSLPPSTLRILFNLDEFISVIKYSYYIYAIGEFEINEMKEYLIKE